MRKFLLMLMLLPGLAWAAGDQVEVTIASSGTTSGEIELVGFCVVGMDLPSALTSTSATWHCSAESGGTFDPAYDGDGNAYAITVAASRYVDLTKTGEQLCGCNYAKLVMGSAEGADRTIKLQLAR